MASAPALDLTTSLRGDLRGAGPRMSPKPSLPCCGHPLPPPRAWHGARKGLRPLNAGKLHDLRGEHPSKLVDQIGCLGSPDAPEVPVRGAVQSCTGICLTPAPWHCHDAAAPCHGRAPALVSSPSPFSLLFSCQDRIPRMLLVHPLQPRKPTAPNVHGTKLWRESLGGRLTKHQHNFIGHTKDVR